MASKASAVWTGSLKEGKGTISTATGVLNNANYSFATRFEGATSGTTPEELIAAAHASCYSMALGAQLGGADRHRHRQAAGEQDDRVQEAPPHEHVAAGQLELPVVDDPVHSVRRDQPAEEHDLGRQEQPHPDLFRIGAKQRWLIGFGHSMLHRNISHSCVLLDAGVARALRPRLSIA